MNGYQKLNQITHWTQYDLIKSANIKTTMNKKIRRVAIHSVSLNVRLVPTSWPGPLKALLLCNVMYSL